MFFLNKQFSWSTIFAKLYLWVRHFPVLGQEGWDVVNQVTHHIAWLCRFCRKVSESFQMKSRRWPPEQMTWKWLNPTWRARKAPCTAEDSVVVWCRCCVVQRSWEGLCALHRTLEPSTTAEEQWSQWKRRQLPRFATSNSCKFWEAELLRFKRFCRSSISVSHSLFICVQVSHGDVHVVRITMSFDYFWPVRHCKMERETRWWFQIFFIFTPIWGTFPYWRSYFSDGLVQPPTRKISTRRYREDWPIEGARRHLLQVGRNVDSFLKACFCGKNELPNIYFLGTCCTSHRLVSFLGYGHLRPWNLRIRSICPLRNFGQMDTCMETHLVLCRFFLAILGCI